MKAKEASRLIRNFASVARLLALARRRNLCAWTKAFRAGATHNALSELNHSGAISLDQYKTLDAWIFWGGEEERKKLGRGWWKPKRKVKEKRPPAKLPKPAAKKRKLKRRRSA